MDIESKYLLSRINLDCIAIHMLGSICVSVDCREPLAVFRVCRTIGTTAQRTIQKTILTCSLFCSEIEIFALGLL